MLSFQPRQSRLGAKMRRGAGFGNRMQSEELDWHEMRNLVDAEPERASQMAYALHSWVESLPPGPPWLSNAGCRGFRFPTGGPSDLGVDRDMQGIAVDAAAAARLGGGEGGGPEQKTAQDSEPDW